MRSGAVWLDRERVGTVAELPDGTCRFAYDPAWLQRPGAMAISVTLPLRAEPWETRGIHPFFDGLIPEGWLLDLASRNWKIDPSDRMALLLAVCADCVGAVRVLADEAV
jgi:serine/threonine-protein kinase HipA